jgi:hypothetical protein
MVLREVAPRVPFFAHLYGKSTARLAACPGVGETIPHLAFPRLSAAECRKPSFGKLSRAVKETFLMSHGTPGGNVRPVLLAIHGVGNPVPGSTIAAVRAALAGMYENDVDLDEYFWNRPGLSPLDPVNEVDLDLDSVVELFTTLRAAALSGADGLGDYGPSLVGSLYSVSSLALLTCLVLPTLLCLGAVFDGRPEYEGHWWGPLAGVSASWLRWAEWFLKPLSAVAGFWAAALLLLGVLKSVFDRSVAAAMIAARAVTICLFGIPIASAALLFSIPWRAVGEYYWKQFCNELVLGIILSPALFLFYLALHWWTGKSLLSIVASGFLGEAENLAVALAALLLVGLTLLLVAPVLKIFLDIFRYVGKPGYRDALLQGLAEKVKALRGQCGSRTFYVLAHSLGSVIAADGLVNFGVWNREDRVVLVTMGSPIRRFFMRFFPGQYFPEQIALLYKKAAGCVPHFHWINVYRRFDYVGSSLGFSPTGGGVDRPTGQWLRTHTGYFSDTRVRDCVIDSLKRLGVLKS